MPFTFTLQFFSRSYLLPPDPLPIYEYINSVNHGERIGTASNFAFVVKDDGRWLSMDIELDGIAADEPLVTIETVGFSQLRDTNETVITMNAHVGEPKPRRNLSYDTIFDSTGVPISFNWKYSDIAENIVADVPTVVVLE